MPSSPADPSRLKALCVSSPNTLLRALKNPRVRPQAEPGDGSTAARGISDLETVTDDFDLRGGMSEWVRIGLRSTSNSTDILGRSVDPLILKDFGIEHANEIALASMTGEAQDVHHLLSLSRHARCRIVTEDMFVAGAAADGGGLLPGSDFLKIVKEISQPAGWSTAETDMDAMELPTHLQMMCWQPFVRNVFIILFICIFYFYIRTYTIDLAAASA